jgi:hypothetical protein
MMTPQQRSERRPGYVGEPASLLWQHGRPLSTLEHVAGGTVQPFFNELLSGAQQTLCALFLTQEGAGHRASAPLSPPSVGSATDR